MATEEAGVLSATMQGFKNVQLSIYEQMVSIASVCENIVTGSLEGIVGTFGGEEIRRIPIWKMPSLPEISMPDHKEINCVYTGAAAFTLTMLLFAFMTLCFVRLRRRSQLKYQHVAVDVGGKAVYSQASLESSGDNRLKNSAAGADGISKAQGDAGGENRIRYEVSTVNQCGSCSVDANYFRDLNDSRITTSLEPVPNTAQVSIQAVLETTGKNLQRGYTMDSPLRRARTETDNQIISQGKSLSFKTSRISSKWSLRAIKKRMNTIKRQRKPTPLSNYQCHMADARRDSEVQRRKQVGAQETFQQTNMKEMSPAVQQAVSHNESSFRVIQKHDSQRLPSHAVSPRKLNGVLASSILQKGLFASNQAHQDKTMGSFNAITQSGNGRIKIKTDWSAFLTSVQEKLRKNPQQQKKSPKKSSPQRKACCQVLKNSEAGMERKIKKRGQIGHVNKSLGRVQKVDPMKPNPRTSSRNAVIPKLVEAIKLIQSAEFDGEFAMESYTIKKTMEPVLSSLKGQGAFSSYTKDGNNVFSATTEARTDEPSVAHGDVSDGKDSILKEYRMCTRDSKARSPLDDHQKWKHSEKFSCCAPCSGHPQGAAHENIGRHNTKFLIERGQTSSNEITSLNEKSLGKVSKKHSQQHTSTVHNNHLNGLCDLDLSKCEYCTFKEVQLPSHSGESKLVTASGKQSHAPCDKIPEMQFHRQENLKTSCTHSRVQDLRGSNFSSEIPMGDVPNTMQKFQPPNENKKFCNRRDQLQFIASSNPFLQRTWAARKQMHKPSPTHLHHSTTVRRVDISVGTSHPAAGNSKKPSENTCQPQKGQIMKFLEDTHVNMAKSKPHNFQFIFMPQEKIKKPVDFSSNQENCKLESQPKCKQTAEKISENRPVRQDRRHEQSNTISHNEFFQNNPTAFSDLGLQEQMNHKDKRGDNAVLSSFTIKSAFEKMDTSGNVIEKILAPNPKPFNERNTNSEREYNEKLSRNAFILDKSKKLYPDPPFSFSPVVQPDTKPQQDYGKVQQGLVDQTLHPIAESGDFAHLSKSRPVHCHERCDVSFESTSDLDVTPPGCFQIGHCYIKGEGNSHWTIEPSEGVSDRVTKRATTVQGDHKHQKDISERPTHIRGEKGKAKIDHKKNEVQRKEQRRNKCQGYPVKKSKSLISVGQMVSELTSKSQQKLNPGPSPGEKISPRKHTKVCKVIYVKPSHRISRHVRINTAPKPQPEPIFFKISNHDFLENRMGAYHELEKKDDYVKYCKLRKVRCYRHEPYKKQLVTSSGSTTPPSGHVAYHKWNRNNCSPSRRGRFVLGPRVDHQCFDDPPQQRQHNGQSDDPSSELLDKLQPNGRESHRKPESDGFMTLRQTENADWSNGSTSLEVSEEISEDNKTHRTTKSTDESKNMFMSNTEDKKTTCIDEPMKKRGNISSLMKYNEDTLKTEPCLKMIMKSTDNLRAVSKKRTALTHNCFTDKCTTAECMRNNRRRSTSDKGNRIPIGVGGESSDRMPTGSIEESSNRITIGLDGDSSYSDLKTEEDNSHYLFGPQNQHRQPSKSPPTTQSHMTQTESSALPINIGIQTSPRLENHPRKILFQYKGKGCNHFPKSLRDRAKVTRKAKATRVKYPCKTVIVQGDLDLSNNPVAQWLQDHTFVNWTHQDTQSSHIKVPCKEPPAHEMTQSQSSTLGTSDWASQTLQSHNVTQTTTRENINLHMTPSWCSHKMNSAAPGAHFKYESNNLGEAQDIGDCPDIPNTKELKDKTQDCQARTNNTFQFRGFSFDQRPGPVLVDVTGPTDAKGGITFQSSSLPSFENSKDNKTSGNTALDTTSKSSIVHVHNTKEEASETSMMSSRLSELQKLCVIRPFWKNANIDEIDRRVKRALRLREELQISKSACAQKRTSARASDVGTSSVNGVGDVDNNNVTKSGGRMAEMVEEEIALTDEVRCELRNVPQTMGSDVHICQTQFLKFPKEQTRVTSHGRESASRENKNKSPNTVHALANSCEPEPQAGPSISTVLRRTIVDKDGKGEKSHRIEPTPRLERSLSFHEDPVSDKNSRQGKANSEHTSSRPSDSNSAQNTLKRVRGRDKNSPPTKISKVENARTITPKLVGELVQNLPQVPLFSFVEWFIETSDPSNFVVSDHSSSSSGKDREERMFRDEIPRNDELSCLVKYHGRNFKLNQGSLFEGMPDTPSTATFAISSRTAGDQTTYDFESLTPTEGLSTEKRYEVDDNSGKCPLQTGDTDDTAPSLPKKGMSKNLSSGYKFGENKDNCHSPFRFSMTEPNSTSTTEPSHSKSSNQDTQKTSESSVKTPTVHLAYDSYLSKKLQHPINDTISSTGTKTGNSSDLYNIYCNIRDNDDLNYSSPKRETEWPVDSTEESVTEEVYTGDRQSQVMFSDDTKDDDVDRCAPGIRHILMKLRQTKDGDDAGGPRHDRMRITLRKSSDVTGIIAKFQNEHS